MRSTATLALLLLSVLLPAPGHAHDYRLGALVIEHPWSRATAPGAPAAGYLVIRNQGETADRLVGADSPRAGRVMLHRTIEADGSTRMQHQGDGIAIPAGGEVRLEPGGYHLMLMQLDERLQEDQRVPLTLRFEHAGKIEVELAVRGLTEGL